MAAKTVHRDDSGPWRERLEAAGAAVDDARAQLEDEIELRDQLILDAFDTGGFTRGQLGRWTRVNPTRISQIIAARALELQGETTSA